MEKPLVSILIPVFNCEEWVGNAISSALAQTWANKEVIVLNDGSDDGTLDIIRGFGDAVRVESKRMGGQNASRGRLTEMSGGEWLVFLDADDELAPDSVEQQMRCSAGADAIYGSTDVARYKGREKVFSYTATAVQYDDAIEAAIRWSLPNTSSMLLRKSAILEVGGWPADVANCTDYALYFKLLIAGKIFRAAPDAMSLYRHWSTKQASYENAMRKSVARLDIMIAAAKELLRLGKMTPSHLQIWSDYMLRCIRHLHGHDREKANAYLHEIYSLNPGYRPAPPMFTRSFGLTFRFLGLNAAQELADVTRMVRRRLNLGGYAEPNPVALSEIGT